MFVLFLIAAIVGYLLGSLPFGYLVARAKGVNIFEVGSKSPGATNVRRVLGHGPGNVVLVLDALKGAAASAWALEGPHRAALGAVHPGTGFSSLDAPSPWIAIGVCGLLFALLGHGFSCFTKFRGGKGVATAAGGFLVLFPIGTLIAAVTWTLALLITRYTSLASMLAGVALTVAAWFLHAPPLILAASAAAMIFVVIRHRANISRLLAGTESKVGQEKGSSDAP